jgi:uncharacterized protein (DUF1697 family)
MPRYVALLRAVNLVKVNRIAMADLRALCEDLGYVDVRTHLQSGNVVFDAKAKQAAVTAALTTAVSKVVGNDITVIVRTAKQLDAVIANNPLGRAPRDPKRFFVAFLSAKPPAAKVKALEAEDFSPERLWLNGADGYADCPNGAAKTKLGAPLWERRLGVRATMRNWSTVTALADVAKGP